MNGLLMPWGSSSPKSPKGTAGGRISGGSDEVSRGRIAPSLPRGTPIAGPRSRRRPRRFGRSGRPPRRDGAPRDRDRSAQLRPALGPAVSRLLLERRRSDRARGAVVVVVPVAGRSRLHLVGEPGRDDRPVREGSHVQRR